MIRNRSVPVQTLLPHLCYRDVGGAIEWLGRAFGFVEDYRYGPADAPQGAMLHLGSAFVMLASPRESRKSPLELGGYAQSVTVFVEDVEDHFRRAQVFGVVIVEELHETPYGERQYGVEDIERHHWLFATHVEDVSSPDWGAIEAAGKP